MQLGFRFQHLEWSHVNKLVISSTRKFSLCHSFSCWGGWGGALISLCSGLPNIVQQAPVQRSAGWYPNGNRYQPAEFAPLPVRLSDLFRLIRTGIHMDRLRWLCLRNKNFVSPTVPLACVDIHSSGSLVHLLPLLSPSQCIKLDAWMVYL